jgi:hypothetical protein
MLMSKQRSNKSAAFLFAIASLAACTDEPDRTFSFKLVLNQVPSDVLEVSSTDNLVVITSEQSGAQIIATREYDDYAIGQQSSVMLMIARAGVVSTSEARPGACALECIYDGCPSPSELTEEVLEFGPPFEFQPGDHGCMECRGGEQFLKACP